MKAAANSRAYSECIELWKRGETVRAREVLECIPADSDGPAGQALRQRLHAMLSPAHTAATPAANPPVLRAPRAPSLPTEHGRAHGDADAASTVLGADSLDPLPGVSIVAACMNRLHNLLKVLPSWLATPVDEIVIVDWSSTDPVAPHLAEFDDPRLRIVRVEGEPRWILTHALNVGLRLATRTTIYKLDCDIRVAPDFVAANPVHPREFVRGFWKLAVDAGQPDQRYTNGTFGALKADLRAIGYYDERILTYGWDDSDIYARLAMDLGLAGRLIDPRSLHHVEQLEAQRLENQSVNLSDLLGRFAATEVEGARNKYRTALNTSWGSYSSAQDYVLQPLDARHALARRTTLPLVPPADIGAMADTLAARQFALWIEHTLPPGLGGVVKQLGFAKLLADAHERGASKMLVDALAAGKGIHFVRCPDVALHPAVRKTLALIADHNAKAASRLVIFEGPTPPVPVQPARPAAQWQFAASGDTIDALARACSAAPFVDALWLEDTLELGSDSCTCTTITLESLTAEVLGKAKRFANELRSRFTPAVQPTPASAMVTSLYDESNLIRLVEYLTCVALNLQTFERVAICYESRDGTLQEILRRLSAKLALQVGRLAILPFEKRPTFEELFSVRHLFPAGTLLAVANADIAFDASVARLAAADLSSTVVVLSRWDVIAGGRDAALIRLENGAPNTFSADAWITSTPFEPDFYLDYPIGTMHCDSFINNQVSLSARYRVVNPCMDVRVFHLHDERFNSSAQKQVSDQEEIQRRYGIERARNLDRDPVKGVGWTPLAHVMHPDRWSHLQQWRPKSLVLDMTASGPVLGGLLLMNLACSILASQRDVVIVLRLRESDAHGSVGELLVRFLARRQLENVLLDIDDRPFDAMAAQASGAFLRETTATRLIEHLTDPDHDRFSRDLYAFVAWPEIAGLRGLRSSIAIDIDSAAHVALLTTLRRSHPWAADSIQAFAETLPKWSPAWTLMVPLLSELRLPAERWSSPQATTGGRPRVSFVTSLFHGGEFLQGYLENVVLAALQVDGEVIIVDANVDNRDEAVITRFLADHPAAARVIDYVRLDHDPGLYACWRLAIERARAPLVTNANLDDRRSPLHTLQLVELLESRPELAGACSSISCVTTNGAGPWYSLTDNQVWFFGEGSRMIGFEDLFTSAADGTVKSRNVMHCMPVWRKALHAVYGHFDEDTYGTSADWAFWLKCARAGEQFYFEEDAFGRYYLNPNSHNRRNDADGAKELKIIHDLIGARQSIVIKQ